MEVKKRNTIQRKLVLEAVRIHGNHPTAEEIYDIVRSEHSSVSRGTVYRNLNYLSDDGFLSRVRMADGADKFDHNTDKHSHIKCQNCEMIFDIMGEQVDPVNELESLSDVVSTETGFTNCSAEVVFFGICPSCS